MKERTFRVKITFQEPILGSQSTGQIASEYIAKRAGFGEMPEEEIETLPDALDKGTTVFHKDAQGRPILFDYQIKGFLKNAGKVNNGRLSCDPKMKNLRAKVQDYVFIEPRRIPIHLASDDEVIEFLERPLRAETPMGPRVALARSEMIGAGAWVEFGMTVCGDLITEDILRELLDYGYHQGIGQWRNAGWGSFIYELAAEEM